MTIFLRNMLLFCFLGALAACGGDGGGNDGTANDNEAIEIARIEAGNAEDLGTAAASGAKQAVDYQSVSDLGFRPEGESDIETFSEEFSIRYSARVAAAPDPFVCDAGSVAQVNNPDGSTTVTFDMCELVIPELGGFTVTVDGVVQSNSSDSGAITTVELLYQDFSIDLGFEVTTIDLEAICSTDNTTLETSCAFPAVEGFDGRIYDLSEATVTGDAISGYFVTATIVDPDHGSFSIATNAALVFACPNDRPLSGALQFTDGAGVLVTVTFNDCDSFTVSYNGTTEIYFW